ncbi:hypothetical protein CL633_04555 [bacterium]|nr:hypothetical protein [bacterium]
MRRSEQNKALELERARPVKFTNFSNEKFSHSFGSVIYTFNPQETIMLEFYKAELFSKHLIDREIIKLEKDEKGNDLKVSNHEIRTKLMAKCLEDSQTKAQSVEEIKSELMNKNTTVNSEVQPQITEREILEQKALQMRQEGTHWKIVETTTGVTASRQKELIQSKSLDE